MAYQVNAKLVVVKPASNSEAGYRHIYQGGMVPVDIDEEQLAQLVESGMVVEVADAAEEPSGDEKPGGNASKAAWVAYAVSQGVDEAEADASTREALRERFADPQQ